ncbi:MAG: EamA family transporter [Flavobacteriales bacterium]|nr:EamA family transporter [Flavobacteriales bacterium]
MNKNSIENWVILLILSIIWGSSFILMKKSLINFSYLEVAFFRLVIAFFVLSPFLISSFKNMKTIYIIPILIVSIIGTLIPAILFAFAQIYLDSANTGMLNALTPIFTFIIGLIFFKKNWNYNAITGILIGLIGSYILLMPSNQNIINTKYSLIVILATICYAISINTIRDKLKSLKPLDIAVISSFFSFLIPITFFLDQGIANTIEKIYTNLFSFFYLIILGVICTSLAIILFNYLIKKTSAVFGSSTTYLIPVFAIIWGVIDNEIIANHEIIGIVIILIGVLVMNYKKLE